MLRFGQSDGRSRVNIGSKHRKIHKGAWGGVRGVGRARGVGGSAAAAVAENTGKEVARI